MTEVAFVMEQTLGHVTHHLNLERWAQQDSTLRAAWIPVSPEDFDRWDRIPGVRGNWSLRGSLRARKQLQLAARQQKFDALFIHTQTVALFTLNWMRRVPAVVSLDSTPKNFDSLGAGYGHAAAADDRWVDRQKFRWNQRTFEACAALTCWSEWAKQSLVHDYGIPPEKVVVIPPGVDMHQWNFAGERTGRPAGQPKNLLFVGGDFVRKGGTELVQAFQNGLQGSCQLDIVTKDAEAAKQYANVQGLRFHLGLSANSEPLRRLYADADIFLFPTHGDCLGIAAIEAMAAGLPVIATRVGGVPEVVKEDVNGLMVPPGDALAIAQAVRSLLDDPARMTAMAAASRTIAETRFDAAKNYKALLSLIKQVAAGRTVAAA